MAAPPKKPGLTLYAHLLAPEKDQSQGATISSAPVRYDTNKNGDDEPQKRKDASLKFQPIKRPQVQKTKPKTTSSSSTHKFSSSVATVSVSSPEKHTSIASSTPQQPSVQRSNFSDWVGGDEDEYYYQDNRPRYNNNTKKTKKKNKGGQETRRWEWDDIYDPSLPNNYADYKHSEEQYRERREWKDRLHHQERKAKKSKLTHAPNNEEAETSQLTNRNFAPPSGLNFAPPSFDNDTRPPPVDDDEDDYYPPPIDAPRGSDVMQGISASLSVPSDATADDAYLRRMQMSEGVSHRTAVPSSPPPIVSSKPTPPPVTQKPPADTEAKRAEAMAKIAAFKAKLQKAQPNSATASTTTGLPSTIAVATSPPQQDSVSQPPPPPPPPPPPEEAAGTISRAPVRYNAPPQALEGSDVEQTSTAPEEPQTKRPGKKGFAERVLKKYGWEKGQSLGATGEGIITPLAVQVEKRKKKSDADGGGWAQPAGVGRIVGGKRRKVDQDPDSATDPRFGTVSSVIKLDGMLTGLDVQHEIEQNNLMQEIGDEFGREYGNVERLFIWREESGGGNEVFVKFNNQLSAVRAVNATDGMTFADNQVVAKFWGEDKFEKGEYA